MANGDDADASRFRELVIPLEARSLGLFIASLLGQPRLMERRFRDIRFEIDLNWLFNLDQIVSQRIASQNTAQLASFSAKFYFANGKTITLEKHSAFHAFNDMSNELCVGVDLRWSYLVHFPLAKLPEKQDIRFSAFTEVGIEYLKPDEKLDRRSFISRGDGDGAMNIAVRFTDLTWGEDIYAHMTTYILAKTDNVPRAARIARRLEATVLIALGAAFTGLGSLLALYSSASAGLAKVAQQFGDLDQPNVHTMQEKIDLLLSLALATRSINVFPLVAFAKGAVVILTFIAIYFLLTVTKASFININDYSNRYLRRYGKNYEFIRYGVGAAILIGIVSGIFANTIYDAIKPWL